MKADEDEFRLAAEEPEISFLREFWFAALYGPCDPLQPGGDRPLDLRVLLGYGGRG